MKTLFTFALAGLLASSSFAANDNDDLMALSDVGTKFKKVNVLLKDGVGKAKVAIMDQDGKMLHQRKVKVEDQDLVIPYDLNELPCGEYKVKITTEEEEVLYTVETFERAPAKEEMPLVAYGKKLDDETVHLAVVGLMEPGVEVKIRYEANGNLIHSEEIDQPEGFKKDYKLKGVSPEDVYFELKDSLGRTRVIHI
ncbi:hypothetical protein [Algoriphagus sp. CAU 1675]|uniref:hypothetical protein n=1 Tax=Algoriphagus sp. CAU 1675 TaxID=3032597 RepID=UPI0023DB3CBB|nr:hypothetical protein [Algoriphagus sp. CAU 1675]MDF2159272.1 hypothetical protein [Algoriphagus sp. CAU 1675]